MIFVKEKIRKKLRKGDTQTEMQTVIFAKQSKGKMSRGRESGRGHNNKLPEMNINDISILP